MNWKKTLLAFVFVDFAALSGYAIYHHGLIGVFKMAVSSWAAIQISCDLVLALSFACYWMVKDARERGVSPVPYLLLTLGTGSFGLLLYGLFRRENPESNTSNAAHPKTRSLSATA